MNALRPILLVFGLVLVWQMIVSITSVPAYILPGPFPVFQAMATHYQELFRHLLITAAEIGGGLLIGTTLGCSCALMMVMVPLVRRWLLPVLVISQAIPVFALAPLLVLWLGYGMASKIGMAVLIIFFPVASSFYYGMQRTNPELLELSRVMGGTPLRILRWVLIPSALPAFGSGLRVAAAVAPIGAVVGEWVGSSSGLGYYMLHANARMQVDKMFAALAILALLSLGLYALVDRLLARVVFWENEGT